MPDRRKLEIFQQVVTRGSFTAAARSLGKPRSTISRTISELEQELGTRLLHRTTRSLGLTEAGSILFEHAQKILAAYEEMGSTVAEATGKPKGQLRICAPTGLGQHLLPDVVAAFLSKYPEARVKTYLTNRRVDPIAEEFDIVLRVGSLPDSSLIVRHIGLVHQSTVASPQYLKGAGSPSIPADLKQHAILAKKWPEIPVQWHFERKGRPQSVDLIPRVRSNDAELLHALCRHGAGIARLPTFLCKADISAGQLRSVLRDWDSPGLDISLLFPSREGLSPIVRTFIDTFTDKMAASPLLRELAAPFEKIDA